MVSNHKTTIDKKKKRKKKSSNSNNMTPKEQETFRRGVMIAFITTQVEMGVADVFKKNPALKNLSGIAPNIIVGNYIVSLFRKMNVPVPSMEEAMINVDTMKRTAKQISDITKDKNFFITNFGAIGTHTPNTQNKDKKIEFTDKQKEELK